MTIKQQQRFIAYFITLCLLLPANPQASPPRDEDLGYWSQNTLEYNVNEKWKAKIGEDLRFREHAGIFYINTYAGVQYKTFSWLNAGADYLQIRQTRTKGKKDIWYWESRPRIYLTPHFSWKGFLLENRNMLEWRLKEEADNTLRYRNLVSLTAPWKWTRFEFQPYSSNEIFIESTRNGVAENRFQAGFKFHLWGPVYGSLYYMRQFSKNADAKWRDTNLLGNSIKISF